jgi:malate/lactate dehydrogenase
MVLYAPNNSKKIVGQLTDLEESILLRGDVFAKNISFSATSDIADIKESDLVVICSGLFATKEEKALFKTVDTSGRNIQSYKNYDMMVDIANSIVKFAPKSNIIVVTNQSDMMTEVVNNIVCNQKVYGIGCYLDTIRYKTIFIEEAKKKNVVLSVKDINAFIMGNHNDNMFLDENNFKVKKKISGLNTLMKNVLARTITRGKEISDLSKDVHLPDKNSGASRLPASAIYKVIEAFTQKDRDITVPLNRYLTDTEAKKMKLSNNDRAELLCEVKKKSIKAIDVDLNTKGVKSLKHCIKSMKEDLEKLYAFYVK